MSLLADALQPLLANGLLTVGGRLPDTSLTGVISAPNSAYALSFDATGKKISLDFRDPAYVRTLIAADMNRLASSCLQSISVSLDVPEEKYWLPWTLVRLYYASFYAAHATVRALGVGCCWLETDDISHLQAIADATFNAPIPWSVASGTYRCDVDTTQGVLHWTKLTGRPHEALWGLFDTVLADTSAAVLTGPLPRADAQAVFAKLQAFRALSSSHQNKAWLSRTRNDIQYKLLHGVWHPTSHDRHARARLRRLTQQWTADPMDIDLSKLLSDPHLIQFCEACAFVIGLCRLLVKRIGERNLSGGRSFISYGALAYARDARVQL